MVDKMTDVSGAAADTQKSLGLAKLCKIQLIKNHEIMNKKTHTHI